MEKYQYSVLNTVKLLHGHFTGKGASLSEEDIIKYYEWLFWRVDKSWHVASNPSTVLFETHIHVAAISTCIEILPDYLAAKAFKGNKIKLDELIERIKE